MDRSRRTSSVPTRALIRPYVVSGSALVELLLCASILILCARLQLRLMHRWHVEVAKLDERRLVYDGDTSRLETGSANKLSRGEGP